MSRRRRKDLPLRKPQPAPQAPRKALLRGLLFLIALVAMLLIWVGGGIYVARQQPLVTPTSAVPVQPDLETAGGGELSSWNRVLLGLYLNLHRGEIESPAGVASIPKPFTVHPGETAATIAPRLERMGLVRNAELFRLLTRYQGVDRKLEAGDYQLRPDMTMRQVLAELLHGRKKGVQVTILEGWRAEQIAELLAARGLAPADEFMAAVQAGSEEYEFLQERPSGNYSSLEGCLFPETYEFSSGHGAQAIVERMVATFAERFPSELQERAREQRLTVHQVVILASIVEREMAVPSEAPLIASVYLNRLRTGMRLDADPTVQYAIGLRQGRKGWWAPLKKGDMTFDSPYNTYRYVGLPPGPICNPGLVSLRAVVEPAESPYFYFVRNEAKDDGSHVFAQTFAEHLANIAKYRKR